MTEFILDSREPITVKVEALVSGDCKFIVNDQKVIIERKSWSDLINSLQSGRLAIQLTQLRGNCDIPILLIHGFPDGISDLQRHNLLLGIKLKGIVVETFFNLESLLKRAKEIADYLAKDGKQTLIPDRYSNPKLGALMWFPGIGYKKANNLLELYQGDLPSIYISKPEPLSRVLGLDLAKRFYADIRKAVKYSPLSEAEIDKLFE